MLPDHPKRARAQEDEASLASTLKNFSIKDSLLQPGNKIDVTSSFKSSAVEEINGFQQLLDRVDGS